MPRITYTKPSITELEREYVAKAMEVGWGSRCYEHIEKFETEFKAFVGSKYAVAASSCTGALTLGLAALGIGKGDEVILADTNWVATAAPIKHLGAKPVFADINPETWCLSPESVSGLITKNTKAIIATHLYGNLCDMQKLLALSKNFKIPIIEDAAEAIGSYHYEKHAGSLGVFGVFSFHGTKTMTTGEGGMFVTNDKELFETVMTLGNHGRSKNQSKQFWPDLVGYKFKMANINAALGLAQLSRIEELVRKKREILEYYKSAFSDVDRFRMNVEGKNSKIGAWMPTLQLLSEKRGKNAEVLLNLNAKGIDARVVFWPLSSTGLFNDKCSNREAVRFSETAINLPSYHDITLSEQDKVVSEVFNLLNC